MLRTIDKPLYTAKTHTEGGRDGRGRTSDGYLDVMLTSPALGRPGTNPEQLLGIGCSACFMGAMRRAGSDLGIRVPQGVEIDAEVTLGNTADMGFALAMKMTVHIPSLSPEDKQRLVDGAHARCPYSLATRGNIDVHFVIP
ncbi:MAG: Ohr family peroxiredoxin [Burkholderiaceae bacterium]|nr:Ohr family peroxiredoxin [Burkholderiaceae bacterium]